MEDSKQLIINQWHLGYVNLSLRYFVFYNIQCLNPLEFVYMKQQQNLF